MKCSLSYLVVVLMVVQRLTLILAGSYGAQSPHFFGCTVKQLLQNTSTNFQKTFIESTLSQAKIKMCTVLLVSNTLPYGCRL